MGASGCSRHPRRIKYGVTSGLIVQDATIGIDWYLLDSTQGFLFGRVSLLEMMEWSIEVHPHCGPPLSRLLFFDIHR